VDGATRGKLPGDGDRRSSSTTMIQTKHNSSQKVVMIDINRNRYIVCHISRDTPAFTRDGLPLWDDSAGHKPGLCACVIVL
jgi:hypothetical protein